VPDGEKGEIFGRQGDKKTRVIKKIERGY